MEVLRTIFSSVTRLDQWLSMSCDQSTWRSSQSPDSYRCLLECVYVCEVGNKVSNRPISQGPVPGRPVFKQTSSPCHRNMQELLNTTHQKLLESNRADSNLLTVGYRMVTENTRGARCGDIENRYPNSLVNMLQLRAWNTLLHGIGENAMLYLLEKTSMFMELPAACFVQLTGEALYNLPIKRLRGLSKTENKQPPGESVPQQKYGTDNMHHNAVAPPVGSEVLQSSGAIPKDSSALPAGRNAVPTGSSAIPTGSSSPQKGSSIVQSGNSAPQKCSSTVPSGNSAPQKFSNALPTGNNVPEKFSSALPSGNSALPTGSSALPTCSSAIPTGSSIIPTDSSAIPTGSSLIPTSSSAVPTCSSAIPTGSNIIPTGSSSLPTDSNALPTSSSIIPTDSSALRTHKKVLSRQEKKRNKPRGHRRHNKTNINTGIGETIASKSLDTRLTQLPVRRRKYEMIDDQRFHKWRKLSETYMNLKSKTGGMVSDNVADKSYVDGNMTSHVADNVADNSYVDSNMTSHVADNSQLYFSDSMLKKVTDNRMAHLTDNTMEPVTGNIMTYVTEHLIEPVIENIIEPVTDNMMENVTDNMMGNVTDNMMENVTDNMMENVTDNTVENVTDNMMENVTDNMVENVTDNMVENVTDNMVENVTDNMMEPLTGNMVAYSRGSVKRKFSEINNGSVEQACKKRKQGTVTKELNYPPCQTTHISCNEDSDVHPDKSTDKGTATGQRHTPSDIMSMVYSKQSLMLRRNVREKIPKTAALWRFGNDVDLTATDLYNLIFCVGKRSIVGLVHTCTRDDTQASRQEMTSEVCDACTINGTVPHTILPLLQDFLCRFRRCPRKALLAQHCPVLKSTCSVSGRKRHRTFSRAPRNVGNKMGKMGRQLKSHHQHRKVYLFVRACVVRSLPDALIGGPHNRNCFLKCISKLISMGKMDKFSLKQAMYGMKTGSVSWLSGIRCNVCRQELLSGLVHWLFSNWVFLLLTVHFYITDTTFLHYRVLYYRQVTWTRLHMLGITGLLNRGIIKPVSEAHVKSQLCSGQALGVSTLRFLPKQKALRPIVNMGVPIHFPKCQSKLGVNKQLLDVHKVLTWIKDRVPGVLGYGKLGVGDIYASWRDFVQHWRGQGHILPPQLYFIKTDISKCFDTIKQDKLLHGLESLLKQELDEECIVRKYFTLNIADGQIQKRFHRHVTTASDFTHNFVTFSKEVITEQGLNNTVLVDCVIYQHVTCDSILASLTSHLQNNFIKVGKQYYRQTAGISQGSVMSSLLCNIYYADMERQLMQIEPGEFLVRIVDDYMYVTPSLQRGASFLNIMLAGDMEYNCHINMEKVATNFPCRTHLGDILPSLNTDWFPWCGLLFNMRTLETSMDFSRFKGTNMRDTVTFDFINHPGEAVKKRLIYCVSHKCHLMFVDRCINSDVQVWRNILLIFLYAMFKLRACITHLPPAQRFNNNPQFLLGILDEMSNTLFKIVWKLKKSDKTCTLPISCKQIHWLCYKAFLMKFHKQPNLKAVKSLVCRKLSTLCNSVPRQMQDRFAHMTMPEDFTFILP